MSSKKMLLFFVVLVVGFTSGTASAHHGNAAYEATKSVTVKGTIVSFFL